MIFYEIALRSIPEFLFTWRVDVENYKNRFRGVADFLEIFALEEGGVLYEYDDGTCELMEPPMLCVITRDNLCKTSAYHNARQQHITVGVRVTYDLRRHDTANGCDVQQLEERMKSNCCVLLPYHVPLGSKYVAVRNCLTSIVDANLSDNPCEELNVLAQWYTLLYMLTDFVMTELRRSTATYPPSAEYYAEKAERYIKTRYMHKITVGDIAAQLGISEGYLHRLFKAVKGSGVLEYTNQYRIEIARQLIENRGLSLADAAGAVGIDDVAYMSRLFKKVVGMSYRTYCHCCNSNTMHMK